MNTWGCKGGRRRGGREWKREGRGRGGGGGGGGEGGGEGKEEEREGNGEWGGGVERKRERETRERQERYRDTCKISYAAIKPSTCNQHTSVLYLTYTQTQYSSLYRLTWPKAPDPNSFPFCQFIGAVTIGPTKPAH